MSNKGQETEAKFYVADLERIAARLKELNTELVQPRVLETNLRFDLPDGSLTKTGQVLRLRRDTEARLTYKGAGQNKSGVLDRQEIEFRRFHRVRERQRIVSAGIDIHDDRNRAHRDASTAAARPASAAVHAATGGVSVTGDSVTTSRK